MWGSIWPQKEASFVVSTATFWSRMTALTLLLQEKTSIMDIKHTGIIIKQINEYLRMLRTYDTRGR